MKRPGTTLAFIKVSQELLKYQYRGANDFHKCKPGFLLGSVDLNKGPVDAQLADNGKRRNNMLETLAIILIILWIFGLVSSYTMGGLIHILLVIAVVVILVRVIQGRRL